MSKRVFDKEAYEKYDRPAKDKLVEVLVKNSNYVLGCDLNTEMYKNGDVIMKNGNKRALFENEARFAFDKITSTFSTIHIPIRKRNTRADFYVVWNYDLTEMIIIKKAIIQKNKDNIERNVWCKNSSYSDGGYYEDFILIPKEDTQWYEIDENLKLIPLGYE